MILVIPLLTWNKEMLIGISAFTMKIKNNLPFLNQSPYHNKVWFQLCIFVCLFRKQQKDTDGPTEANAETNVVITNYDSER